jgi:hypothetical protein
MATMELKRFRKIGPGFFNLKVSHYCLQVLKGMVDIGSHMSLVKIESTGKFLVLDICSLDSVARSEFDFITNKGLLIDAVIATHPFHTSYFESFYKTYPTLKYYGTPRHIKKLTAISWSGDISNEDTLKLWEPEVLITLILSSNYCQLHIELLCTSLSFNFLLSLKILSLTLHLLATSYDLSAGINENP